MPDNINTKESTSNDIIMKLKKQEAVNETSKHTGLQKDKRVWGR